MIQLLYSHNQLTLLQQFSLSSTVVWLFILAYVLYNFAYENKRLSFLDRLRSSLQSVRWPWYRCRHFVVVLDYFLYIYIYCFPASLFHVIFNIFLVWFSEHKVSNFPIATFFLILRGFWVLCGNTDFQFIAHLPLKVLPYSTRTVMVCTASGCSESVQLSVIGRGSMCAFSFSFVFYSSSPTFCLRYLTS